MVDAFLSSSTCITTCKSMSDEKLIGDEKLSLNDSSLTDVLSPIDFLLRKYSNMERLTVKKQVVCLGHCEHYTMEAISR